MNTDLRIVLGLAGSDNISVVLQGPTIPQGLKVYHRRRLRLNVDALEALRRGEIDQPEFDRLVQDVNEWLLDQEIRPLLARSIPANGSSLRIEFVVHDDVRTFMAGLPLELLWHDTPRNPLVLRRDVQSLSYMLEKSPTAAHDQASDNWPFKVLIVRANPPDLGGEVPAVSGIRDLILMEGARFGPGMLQVDVISNEPGIGRPATWSNVREQLKQSIYYTLVIYLGHGELVPAHTGGEPVGHLFMESEDGGGHQPISSPQIALLFSHHPVPVIVLIGCFTGAEAAGTFVRQRGGEQGVAQALVNSSVAGVQIAVGMRTELRNEAAVRFLEAFFLSLLSAEHAGNIDCAVRAGRKELFLDGLFPPSWAAPIVFRAKGQEPTLPYLAQPVSFEISEEMEMLLKFRAEMWKPLAAGVPFEDVQRLQTHVGSVEQLLRTEGVKHGPLLMPKHVIIQQVGELATLTIELAGALSVKTLSGRVLIGNNAATVSEIKLARPVENTGFDLMTKPNDKNFFEIRSKAAGPQVLPEGSLLEVSLQAAAATPGLHPITLDVQEIDPKARYWPGENVLMIPRS